MIKKSLTVISALILFCSLLSGCAPSGSRTETDQKYMVSAFGFDNADGNIKISVETIIVNSENADAEQKLEVLTGEGLTVESALEEVGKSLAKPLLLSHCGIIVLGETLSAEQVGKICNYCFRENEITLSVYVVSSESGNKLLSCEPVSSVAVGYDVMGLIEQQSSRTGVNYKNRYYEVEAGRERTQSIFSSPIIRVTDEKFTIDGMKIYKDDKSVAVISNHQAILYSILTDTYGKGEVEIDNEKYKITNTAAKYKFQSENQPGIHVDIKINSGVIDAKTNQTIKNEINELIKTLNATCKTDAFGFENILYHENEKAWEKVKDNYIRFYEDSEIKINLTVNG